MEKVILVNELDQELGVKEKLATHLDGALHRAVSVFLFNDKKELLIQQRAFSKYHSGGLWSNTCCGHPRPGESTMQAALRRLHGEMGIRASLEKAFDFIYRAELDKGLIEHEFDHVFVGKFEGVVHFNTEEVHAYRWISVPELEQSFFEKPQEFTFWFKLVWPKVAQRL